MDLCSLKWASCPGLVSVGAVDRVHEAPLIETKAGVGIPKMPKTDTMCRLLDRYGPVD